MALRGFVFRCGWTEFAMARYFHPSEFHRSDSASPRIKRPTPVHRDVPCRLIGSLVQTIRFDSVPSWPVILSAFDRLSLRVQRATINPQSSFPDDFYDAIPLAATI
jgi:hypothetical protein